MSTRRLKLLSANIQAGSSTRGYHDYFARSWSHVLPAGNKRGALDTIAQLAAQHDIVGLQESDPGSLRSGFTNQTHYLAERGGFDYWSHQPNRSMGGFASSANGLLSRLEPVSVSDHPLPGRIAGPRRAARAFRRRRPRPDRSPSRTCRSARPRACRNWRSSPNCCTTRRMRC